MNDVDRLKQHLQEAAREFSELAEWEQVYLTRRLVELGRPMIDPEVSQIGFNKDDKTLEQKGEASPHGN